MYGVNWPELIAGFIMVMMVVYYISILFKTKDNKKFDYIFSRSSQITFLAFILGFGVLIVKDIIGNIELIWLLIFGAIISVINAVSIYFYSKKIK